MEHCLESSEIQKYGIYQHQIAIFKSADSLVIFTINYYLFMRGITEKRVNFTTVPMRVSTRSL